MQVYVDRDRMVRGYSLRTVSSCLHVSAVTSLPLPSPRGGAANTHVAMHCVDRPAAHRNG